MISNEMVLSESQYGFNVLCCRNYIDPLLTIFMFSIQNDSAADKDNNKVRDTNNPLSPTDTVISEVLQIICGFCTRQATLNYLLCYVKSQVVGKQIVLQGTDLMR